MPPNIEAHADFIGNWLPSRHDAFHNDVALPCPFYYNEIQAPLERASFYEEFFIGPDRDRLIKNIILRAFPDDFKLTGGLKFLRFINPLDR